MGSCSTSVLNSRQVRTRLGARLESPVSARRARLVQCYLHHDVQPPAPFAVLQQVGTGVFPTQVLTVIFSHVKGQLDPSLEAENRHLRAVNTIVALYPAEEKGVRVLFPLLGERAWVRARSCTLINPHSGVAEQRYEFAPTPILGDSQTFKVPHL